MRLWNKQNGTRYGVTRNAPLTANHLPVKGDPMAANKGTHSRRKRTRNAFSAVKGKIVDSVEIKPHDHGYGLGIMFQDRTYLSFDVDVEPSITVKPELSDWKTGNYKPLKRWPVINS